MLRPSACALVCALAFFALAAGVAADDWPQWRGPNRDGISREALGLAAWPQDGEPKVAWRAQVGRGHSTVVVSGGLAYTVGWDGEKDTVFCLDAATGKEKWRQSYPCKDIVQWSGPRATPTLHGGMVFTLGQHGQLRAWDAMTGAPRWSLDLPKTYEPDVDYGFAWSPLIAGDLLLLAAGSRGLAVRVKDGSIAWGADEKRGACISPAPFEMNGIRGAAMVVTDEPRENVYVVGVEAATGRELWRFGPWREKWGAACADLVIDGASVFLSTAEQYKQCVRFTFAPGNTKQDWTNRNLSTYTAGPVLIGGHLYGVDKAGLLRCLDWKTGEEKWTQRGFDGHGTLSATSDGHLIIQAAKSGHLVIAAVDPSGYRELRRMQVFKEARDTFTVPVLAGGRIYCRSYAGEIVCLDLRQ